MNLMMSAHLGLDLSRGVEAKTAVVQLRSLDEKTGCADSTQTAGRAMDLDLDSHLMLAPLSRSWRHPMGCTSQASGPVSRRLKSGSMADQMVRRLSTITTLKRPELDLPIFLDLWYPSVPNRIIGR